MLKSIIRKMVPEQVKERVREYRTEKTIQKYPYYNTLKLFYRKKGIEIGGPSRVFGNNDLFPIYRYIKSLDGVNFSSYTVWEGTLNEGKSFSFYKKKTGNQYISEASDLNKIADGSYDFLVASHCLEHCANALKTVTEWKRVIKKDGLMLLILPDRNHTFDHKRPITSFEHLVEDFKNNVGEDDLTHFDEIMELHDLSLDAPAGTKEQFMERSRKNFENRCLHHHVFDLDLLKKVFDHLGFKTIYTTSSGIHQLIIGRKQ